MHLSGIASAATLLLAMSACNGVNDPFALDDSTGSCRHTTSDGYDYCEDFLGTEYNQSVAQNTCATGNGTWSSNTCSGSGAVGTCAIPIGGNAQNIQYTYFANNSSATGPATALTVETACGLAGGTFAAQ
jgi:hypothetical protein